MIQKRIDKENGDKKMIENIFAVLGEIRVPPTPTPTSIISDSVSLFSIIATLSFVLAILFLIKRRRYKDKKPSIIDKIASDVFIGVKNNTQSQPQSEPDKSEPDKSKITDDELEKMPRLKPGETPSQPQQTQTTPQIPTQPQEKTPTTQPQVMRKIIELERSSWFGLRKKKLLIDEAELIKSGLTAKIPGENALIVFPDGTALPKKLKHSGRFLEDFVSEWKFIILSPPLIIKDAKGKIKQTLYICNAVTGTTINPRDAKIIIKPAKPGDKITSIDIDAVKFEGEGLENIKGVTISLNRIHTTVSIITARALYRLLDEALMENYYKIRPAIKIILLGFAVGGIIGFFIGVIITLILR